MARSGIVDELCLWERLILKNVSRGVVDGILLPNAEPKEKQEYQLHFLGFKKYVYLFRVGRRNLVVSYWKSPHAALRMLVQLAF